MILVVASGKGGTGKTTVATSLAEVAAEDGGRRVHLLDCDVETPNVASLLHPTWSDRRAAGLTVPVVDADRCLGCGACADACVFGALAVAGGQVLVFDGLCHGCGRCVSVCPTEALGERLRTTGQLSSGAVSAHDVAEGRLEIGETMATPVIGQLKRWRLDQIAPDDLAILDAPPGTACSLVATLDGADAVVLVAEPTPFGLHDLRRAVRIARGILELPVFVVLNRDDGEDGAVVAYCRTAGLPLLMRLPFDRRVAEAAALGRSPLGTVPEWRRELLVLLRGIEARCAA